jgi:Flp pilus assembly pilin Flp
MHKLYEHILVALRSMKREEGQGATEYGLVIAFLVIALAVTVGALGTSIGTFLTGVGTALEGLIP